MSTYNMPIKNWVYGSDIISGSFVRFFVPNFVKLLRVASSIVYRGNDLALRKS